MLYRRCEICGKLQDWDEDIEATANAELGDLVRRMPEYWSLVRGSPWALVPKRWRVENARCEVVATGDTPEAALEAALKGVEVPK